MLKHASLADNLVAFVLVGFGGWRIAHLLVYEDGPSDVFATLRSRLGVPAEGEIRGFVPRLLTCVYCLSFWTVAALTAAYFLEPKTVLPFAAWGLAVLLDRIVRGSPE